MLGYDHGNLCIIKFNYTKQLGVNFSEHHYKVVANFLKFVLKSDQKFETTVYSFAIMLVGC